MKIRSVLCSISPPIVFALVFGCGSNGGPDAADQTVAPAIPPPAGAQNPSTPPSATDPSATDPSAVGTTANPTPGTTPADPSAPTTLTPPTTPPTTPATPTAPTTLTPPTTPAATTPTPDPTLPTAPPPPVVPFTASYHIGADITWVQHDEFYGATYVDTDGVTKDILEILKNHGFNSVRMRLFVDPLAVGGIDQIDGFGGLAHTVTMAQRIKQAGMGFYLAMHYADIWADPGKQCIPLAWQQDTFDELTTDVYDYTLNVMTTLRDAGASPDLVQVGNEITPGMLIHICDALGLPLSVNAVNGQNNSTAGWDNLAALLTAGIQAIDAVDPGIETVLHIDRGGDLPASIDWLDNAIARDIPFDVFADTAYVRWQGQPSGWQNTFATLAAMYPTLSFIIPEHGNEIATSPATPSTMRIANDTIFGIANNRGIGTWFYEPEHPQQSGIGVGLVVTDSSTGVVLDPWPVFTFLPETMAVYDQMRIDYASRL